MELQERRIVLGVCGGIAAYKACELVRQLRAQGAQVQAVMTRAAQRFVGAASLQALTGQPVADDLWAGTVPDGMAHIALSRGADAILVAPASAHKLAQIANGLCDDLLSSLVAARPVARCRLLLAPAMNVEMWDNPANQRNVARLREDGALLLGPASGAQACGETGPGRLLEPEAIVAELIAAFQPKPLRGRRVLVTAGPTFEAIDPVRVIGNRSSGKMGYAVARAAWEAGAQVTLVSGPTALATPHGIERIDVQSAQQMLDAVLARVDGADVFIAVAAVADWRPQSVGAEKIKKQPDRPAPVLDLTPNPDILASVAALPTPPLCVGFAAESENVEENARAKLASKRLALVVANQVRDTLGRDEAAVSLVEAGGTRRLPAAPKLVQARHIVAAIAQRLQPAAG